MKDRSTEYMYASARIRSLEAGILGRDRLAALLESKGAREAVAMLGESGVELVVRQTPEGEETDIEQTLAGILSAAFDVVSEIAPEPRLFRYLKYPYDCNNVKAAIKAEIRGVGTQGLLFDFGTLTPAEVTDAVAARDFSALPQNMANAAQLAVDAYAESGDPQRIDLLLDRAAYADMLARVSDKKCGDAFLLSVLREKIDLTNIMICLRVIRMGLPAGSPLLCDSLIEGGTLPRGLFVRASGDEETLLYELAHSSYAKLAESAEFSGGRLSACERVCDDFYMEKIREAKYIPFGAALLGAYLTAREYEVKNIRIIIAGKNAGLSAATIRERIRESYV